MKNMSTAPPPVAENQAQAVIDLEKQFVLQNYARYPLVLARGKGCHVSSTPPICITTSIRVPWRNGWPG
jgi:hypothetical protein